MNEIDVPSAISPIRSDERFSRKAVVVLILVGLAGYANSFSTPFHLDDGAWIVDSEKIDDFGAYLWSMKTRPSVALSLYLNHRVNGLNVAGYHLVNLAIHIAAALAFFGLMRRTLLLPRWEGKFSRMATGLALAAALLWMVHPLQTQAVTYIIQRCESLMGLCYFLTLYCLVRGTQTARRWPWYVGTCLSCAIGAGSKEAMITVLPIALAFDRLFIATSWREIAQQRFAVYGGLMGIWMLPLVAAYAYLSQGTAEDSAGFAMPHLPVYAYWMTQAWVVLYYMSLIFIPFPLHFQYRGWPITDQLSDFWPAGLLIGVMLGGTAWLLWKRHWIGFLGLWFFGTLSVTCVIPLLDIAFEHRLYLPTAAVSVLAVIGGYLVLSRVDQPRQAAIFGVAAVGTISAALLWLTVKRNEDYRSDSRLFASVHELYPKDAHVMNVLAADAENSGQIDEARSYYEKSLRLDPTAYETQFPYGMLLNREDKWENGLPRLLYCMNEIQYSPLFNSATGQAHYQTGYAFALLGRWGDAETHFRKAIELVPVRADYHGGLARVLTETGRAEESGASYAQALALDPDWPAATRRFADKMLHRYPRPSRWTAKEALFHAKQAAESTENKDLVMIDVLVESYAANGLFAEAQSLARQSAKGAEPAWLDEQRRVIAFYRQHPYVPE